MKNLSLGWDTPGVSLWLIFICIATFLPQLALAQSAMSLDGGFVSVENVEFAIEYANMNTENISIRVKVVGNQDMFFEYEGISQGQFTILNTTGQAIYSQVNGLPSHLDLRPFPSGNYKILVNGVAFIASVDFLRK